MSFRGKQQEACPVGTAFRTSAGREKLKDAFDTVIHTTPPFYKYDDDPERKLMQCYTSALRLAFHDDDVSYGQNNAPSSRRVAVPLLGSGARGFTSTAAIDVASVACIQWLMDEGEDYQDAGSNEASAATTIEQTIAFGLLESKLADQLWEKLRRQYNYCSRNSDSDTR